MGLRSELEAILLLFLEEHGWETTTRGLAEACRWEAARVSSEEEREAWFLRGRQLAAVSESLTEI